MKKVKVDLGDRSYDIVIQKGLLQHSEEALSKIKLGSKGVLITNGTVGSLYAKSAKAGLEKVGAHVEVLTVREGEEFKTLRTAEDLFAQMAEAGLDRSSFVVSLGGGVIGDLAGFVAATYMRGIDFVQIPTTLLAQVDSSVGGKVGVNLLNAKNMVGAFYQPKMVLIDPKVLASLPDREMRAGAAEVIKYGIIWDEDLFDYIEKNLPKIMSRDAEVLTAIIAKSCQIKGEVVQKDERENGLRAILNYGHTIGHAIESACRYKRYVHGEAIAIGMVCAATMGQRMSLCSQDCLERQENLLKEAGLPVGAKWAQPQEVYKRLFGDKKARAGVLRFILPRKIGEVIISDKVPENILKGVLQERIGGKNGGK